MNFNIKPREEVKAANPVSNIEATKPITEVVNDMLAHLYKGESVLIVYSFHGEVAPELGEQLPSEYKHTRNKMSPVYSFPIARFVETYGFSSLSTLSELLKEIAVNGYKVNNASVYARTDRASGNISYTSGIEISL